MHFILKLQKSRIAISLYRHSSVIYSILLGNESGILCEDIEEEEEEYSLDILGRQ